MIHSEDLKLEKLKSIIKANKTRFYFEQYICTLCMWWDTNPEDITHPTQVGFLDNFICSAFRHRAHINLQEIRTYLSNDLAWSEKNTTYVLNRIRIGFEILQAYKKF